MRDIDNQRDCVCVGPGSIWELCSLHCFAVNFKAPWKIKSSLKNLHNGKNFLILAVRSGLLTSAGVLQFSCDTNHLSLCQSPQV